MNKIVALTLTASIALASLTGCAAKDAQQKETNVSGISNSEENDNRDNDSQYQDPENIVFEDDMSATIDIPVDDIKVTFDGKELMPGRDTAEEIKASFPDTFTDNSRFNINRWNPEYIVGSNAELMCAVCGGKGAIHNSILNARVCSINVRVRFCAFPRIYSSSFVRRRDRGSTDSGCSDLF